MIFSVFSHTIIVTVPNLSTLTNCIQNGSVVAPLTSADEDFFLLELECKLGAG